MDPPSAIAAAAPAAPGRSETWSRRVALLAILAAASLLVAWNIGREGFSNDYYAAAVRSMLNDPVTFLFGGFDAGRYITLDKQPLGFQLQAVSAAVLGFNGLALLLPQLVATVLSVGLVYLLVRPAWGTGAALLAAGALAVTPVSVATARNTTVDATLVVVLLAAALALQRGLASGRGRWLALAFALVGIGFEIKMLEAYLVLPAFGAAWLIAAPGSTGQRARQLGIAALLLLAVSFVWAVVVAVWPVDYRPWIGGSPSNSLFDLALGYNGLDRLATGPAFGDTGTAGPLRFLEPVLAGQVGWLLPLAGVGVLLALPVLRPRRPEDDDGPAGEPDALRRARIGSFVLWTGWLVTCLVFFSIARFWHRHYLVVMAPAVAACAGIAVSLGWRAVRGGRPAGLLLPAAAVLAGLLAAGTIGRATDLAWLATPVLLADLGVAAALALAGVAGRLRSGPIPTRLAAVFAALAVAGMLMPPAVWSVWTVAGETPIDPTLPTGGPPIADIRPGPISVGGDGSGRVFDPRPNRTLLDHVARERGDATWILAVEGGLEAAPIIVATGQPVMAIGGFQGRDPALAVDGFRLLVREGRVRFASAGKKISDLNGDPPPTNPTASDLVLDWVVASCDKVPGFETLYDCAGHG